MGGNEHKPWYRSLASWLFILLAGGTITYYWTDILDTIPNLIDPPLEKMVFDFQAEQRCPSGGVAYMRRQAQSKFELSNGADNLVICDTEKLETTADRLALDLADRYAGCLEAVRTLPPELALLRLSPHVCKVPGTATIICDGASARQWTGIDSRGKGKEPNSCSEAQLEKFGFH